MSKNFFGKVVAPVAVVSVMAMFGNVACSSDSEAENGEKQERIGAVFANALDDDLCANETNALDTVTSIKLPSGDMVVRSEVIGGNPDYGLYKKPANQHTEMPGLAFVSDDTSRFVNNIGLVSKKDNSGEVRQKGVEDVADAATKRIVTALSPCIS